MRTLRLFPALKRLVLLWIALAASIATAKDSVSLSVGEEQPLNFDDLADSVNVERGGIITVEKGETKRVVILKGRAPGTTGLTIALKNGTTLEYNVTVSGGGGSGAALVGAAKAAAQAIAGLTATTKGNKVHVSGTLHTHVDMDRFAAVKGQYSSVIVDLTEKQIVENDSVVKTINRVLGDNGIPNLKAHSYGKLIVLEGSAKDDAQKKLALRIAQMIYPTIEDQIDQSSNGAPSISIEVVFIEVQKKDMKQFGFPGFVEGFSGAPANAGTAGGVRGSVAPVGGSNGRFNYVVGPFSSFLKLIQQKSMSRVLSNPKLVTRSGMRAKFHSGDSIFFTEREVKDQDIQYKVAEVQLGITLEILPKIDAIGQIDAEIATQIKEIGSQRDVEGRPVLSGSEVSTAVTIKDGYSILLSGLIKKRERKNIDRVPLLADIPIVGELFKSRDLHNEETELLVLVTMNRVQGTNELIKAGDRLWQKSDDVEFSIFD